MGRFWNINLRAKEILLDAGRGLVSRLPIGIESFATYVNWIYLMKQMTHKVVICEWLSSMYKVSFYPLCFYFPSGALAYIYLISWYISARILYKNEKPVLSQGNRANTNNVISITHIIPVNWVSFDRVVKIFGYETYTATIYSIFLPAPAVIRGRFLNGVRIFSYSLRA